MDSIVHYFAAQGLDFWEIIKLCGILLGCTLVITLLGRIIFGRHSLINSAISSAIGILFIYTVQVVLYAFPNEFSRFITPLPFITISGDRATLFQFAGADYTIICSQLLSTIILAFIMNLIDRVMPKGRNIVVWLFFRIITILGALLAHFAVVKLFNILMPEGIVTYAPTILLALLIIMLLTGALKIIVGAIMATVNPLIAALYTFFFASIVGKQITKAVETSAIIAACIWGLNKMGIFAVSIAPAVLLAYIPFLIALIFMWYVCHRNL